MTQAVRHLEDLDTGVRYRATVRSNQRITSDESEEEIRELVLDLDRRDFKYEVGQSIGVIVPGDPTLGQEEHIRLYSVADLPDRSAAGTPEIRIAVKRCFYLDSYSGERYPGIASNYLCDREPGDVLTIAGPFGVAFEVPRDPQANLILIGTGTGIAPFRAFVKHLYRSGSDWKGRVWLFYGANSGLEMLYMNDVRDDFTQYYDHDTFEAFRALSPRPSWADPIAWDYAIEQRAAELWDMLGSPHTYVYVAGLEKMRPELDRVFASIADSPQDWERRKAELMAGRRWVELLY
ncbi:MAG: ferredoxin-NADP reductase [bacterium]